MSIEVAREDWDALIEVLDRAISVLDGRKVQPVKESLLEFTTTAAMLGLEDVADAVTSMLDFLVNQVGPGWDAEAAGTLSFTIAGFREKMASEPYSPAFAEGMKEILLFLDFFEKEEEQPPPATTPQKATVEPPPPAPRKAEPEPQKTESKPPEPAPAPRKAGPVLPGAGPASHKAEPAPSGPEATLPEPVIPSPAAPGSARPTEPDTFALETAEPASRLPSPTQEIDILSEIFPPEPPDDDTDRLVEQLLREESLAAEPPEQPPSPSPPPEEVPLPPPTRDYAPALYTEMLKLDPTSSVFVRLAEELSTQGIWSDTAEVCRRGLLHHPANLRARVLLGLALREMGETREAVSVLTEARMEIEKNALIYRVLAEIAEEAGNTAQAEHLIHIYDTFRERERHLPGHLEPQTTEFLPRRQSSAATEPASPVEERLMNALTRLLARFDARTSRPSATTPRLFSSESREKLKKALSSRVS